MKVKEIREKLLAMQDKEYRDFQAKLIPTVDPKRIIGTRTPQLRDLAKELLKAYDCSLFLDDLPHKYFDEDQLHAFILSGMKDYDECMGRLEIFLPYVDNWATCDQMSPKVFKKHKEELLKKVKVWIASDDTYTVRFGIGMLMEHFLDDDFDKAYPKMVAGVKSEEYYVNMMVAWYFATALAKQYDAVIPYIEKKKLSAANHNKAIQKSIESNRVTPEHKEYLRSLKVK
ncbi:MAG: DNA alkylation repair protein [Lachnospiraceae bacterium]|nr:DNA alkylation repair protein [Lachnospiraceae bacterium]